MASRWVKGAVLALVLASLVTLSACSSSSEPSSDGETVTLDFWASANGYDKAVALWNESHPDIKIDLSQIPAGSVGGYSKMQNAVRAGNAPCLGQVGYDTLMNFVASGAVMDISQYANPSKGQFVPWTWNMSSVGDQAFGIPVDTGPTALFYRSDLFREYGISVPRTWDEFAAAAQEVHAADPSAYLTTTPQDAYDLGALAWQAGGRWFDTANDRWQVTIDSAPTMRVAGYWQDLLDRDLVTSEPMLDTAWFEKAQNGQVLSLISAAWAAPLIAENLPDLSGKWAVAPMPQWTAGEQAAGNRGGSTTVVLEGCEHPQQATEFAVWLSTNAESVTTLIEQTGIYPAATSGQELPAANQPSEYFGGQNIYQVFKTAAQNTSSGWVWGPTMNQVQSDLRDGLQRAGAGQSTIPRSVTAAQESTVAAMENQGLDVGD